MRFCQSVCRNALGSHLAAPKAPAARALQPQLRTEQVLCVAMRDITFIRAMGFSALLPDLSRALLISLILAIWQT